jgi:hypothetical protein
MFCRPITLGLLYYITETIQVARGANIFLECRMLASPALDRFTLYMPVPSLTTAYVIISY